MNRILLTPFGLLKKSKSKRYCGEEPRLRRRF
jgi:hypothetical protein